MSTVGDLKKILSELNTVAGSDTSAIISRSGIPIAWELPDDVAIEDFATMAATLLGAGEVVYTSLNKPPPGRVVVQSDNGSLLAVSLGENALLAAMCDGDEDNLFGAVEAATREIVEVLSRDRE